MPDLSHLRETIGKIFDILDLIVVRSTILGLAIAGAYAIFKKHPPPAKPSN